MDNIYSNLFQTGGLSQDGRQRGCGVCGKTNEAAKLPGSSGKVMDEGKSLGFKSSVLDDSEDMEVLEENFEGAKTEYR